MEYWKVLTKETILDSLEGEDISSVLEELLSPLIASKALKRNQVAAVRKALESKVEIGATGAIGHGVAVPHVKVPGVERTLAVFGRSREGVDFGAPDGVPVTLFFLVVGPEDAPEEHLGFLRWIAGLSRSGDFRNFAMHCKNRKELRDLLVEMSS